VTEALQKRNEVYRSKLQKILAQRQHGVFKHRILNPEFNKVGAATEFRFAKEFSLPEDPIWAKHEAGDGGIDWREVCGYNIDVKGSPTPYNLLVEVDRANSDIYALGGYYKATEDAVILGWTYHKELLKREPDKGEKFGHGITNYWIPRNELRSVVALKELLEVAPTEWRAGDLALHIPTGREHIAIESGVTYSPRGDMERYLFLKDVESDKRWTCPEQFLEKIQ
jgi:hypothetical protein